MTEMTVDELRSNAKIMLYSSYGCAIIDGVLSAIGIYMFEDSRLHAPNILVGLGYLVMAIVVAMAAIIAIRYSRLRKTSYVISSTKDRTDTVLLGSLAGEKVEQEIVDQENIVLDRIIFISWIYEVGSNAFPFIILWWGSILPLLPILHHAYAIDKAGNALVTVASIIGGAWLIPFLGHRAEAWGYKCRDAADKQEDKEEEQSTIRKYRAAQEIKQSTSKLIN